MGTRKDIYNENLSFYFAILLYASMHFINCMQLCGGDEECSSLST